MPTKAEIKHIADRALRDWARTITSQGEDLGFPHMSPEQRLLPSQKGPTYELTDAEERVLQFMATLKDEKLIKVAVLAYLEEQAWYGRVRVNGGWRDLHNYTFVICRKPKKVDWLKYVEANYGISKTTYYDLLSKLRHRVFALL